MYDRLPGLILGYHGCDRSVGEAVLSGKMELKASNNDYDWLGHGIYFWEHNPTRAVEWALYGGHQFRWLHTKCRRQPHDGFNANRSATVLDQRNVGGMEFRTIRQFLL